MLPPKVSRETNSHRRWPETSHVLRKRTAIFITIFLLAFGVRFLTMQFMKTRLHDAAWFQFGSYQVFEKRAANILAGRERPFWIDDPSRTDLVQYPPAYPWWIALIYRVTGNHSAYSVQRVQWVCDLLLSLLLITGIAVTAYGWRAAIAAGVLTALSPLLAMYGAWPSADGPTTWFVLGSVWMLLMAARRNSASWALGAGMMLGIACWLRVNPLYLAPCWAIALILVLRAGLRKRIVIGSAVVAGMAAVISPIVIRNYVVFPDFTPTGGTIGVNLWEGLGETEFGRQNGFIVSDTEMVERERQKMGLPRDFPLEPFWPDGIRRDKERRREALALIKQRPVWYVGVMLGRMWGMLKVAGAPLPFYGSAGINVTSEKCLSPERRGGVVAGFVTALGMIQSVSRFLFLPLAVAGLWLGIRRNLMLSVLLIVTILYYLVPGTAGHAEIRYMLPMHGLLIVFAGVSLAKVAEIIRSQVFSIYRDRKGS